MARKKSDNEPLLLHSTAGKEVPISNAENSQRSSYSTKEKRQEFFLPVSGFVWLYEEEVDVVNHPAFQRLGRIYQLGQSYVVYRGATHKRLEHALGTLHVVQRMIEAVDHNGRKNKPGAPRTKPTTEEEMRFIRVGALLHDIGHLAAGHTVEDELCLVGKHDADRRLSLIFRGENWRDSAGRTLEQLINEKFAKYVPPGLQTKVTSSEIVRLLIRKPPMKDGHYDAASDEFASAQSHLKESTEIRLEVCQSMIGNTICADLLDYLHRDWYHVGKPRPFDDRILQYMEIRAGNVAVRQPDRFVISLGKRPKIRTDAISAILELLEWRYQLAESVLFHRTKLSAAAMLDRALFEMWGEDGGAEIEEFLLPLSDEEMLAKCRELAEKKETKGLVAAKLLSSIEKRQLFCHLSTRFYEDLPAEFVAAIERTYGQTAGNHKLAAANRNRVLRVLESDFGLSAGSLAMYCPGGVNAKIARVQIALGEDIDHFSEYERRNNDSLSGGHLDAQLRRFRRLWRVHFFIERSERERIGELVHVLKDAIQKLALGNLTDEEDASHASRSFAEILTQMKESPWKERKVRSASVDAAYQASQTATGSYPMGANSILSFIEPQ